MSDSNNSYLDQVIQKQQVVERELQRGESTYAMPPGTPMPAMAVPQRGGRARLGSKMKMAVSNLAGGGSDNDEGPGSVRQSNDYRITGWLRKTVVVSPNVYVVHTRTGSSEPLLIGMGSSFRYNPFTDAFLIIPASLQTLIINARCISAERQGILVQAYLQWIIDDINTAYRKLDFSDTSDPMRIVNVQLREQAEAAIKDKVATMPIDAILSDKQPIIQELTTRLREVAEGNRENDRTSGLGLKIVTVQIKEAVVSSTNLWENLQKPFRAERAKVARLAELESQKLVADQERVDRQIREEKEREYERKRMEAQAAFEQEQFDRGLAEKTRRQKAEQEAERSAIADTTATEKIRREADLELQLHLMDQEKKKLAQELEALKRRIELDTAKTELENQRVVSAIDLENLRHQANISRQERDLTLERGRREIDNDISEMNLRSKLIENLPQIAAALPKPDELHAIHIGEGIDTNNSVSSLIGILSGLLRFSNISPPKIKVSPETKEG